MKIFAASILLQLLCVIPAVHSWSVTSYDNSSKTSTVPVTTHAPIYCGTCAFYYEVHAHVWWSSILTDYIATIIYTVEKRSGKTIGSSLKFPMNATVLPGKQNVTAYAGGGPVEYTTLNNLESGAMATLVQSNMITLNGTKNGYGVSTQFVNTSLTGTARTTCKYSYYGPNPTNTTKLPGLPAMTEYSYTTVIPYDSTYNMSNANAYGLDILASEVATFLHLTVPNCTYYGGGTGTLKVGVTALTDISTVYAPAQVSGTTTESSTPPIQTTAQETSQQPWTTIGTASPSQLPTIATTTAPISSIASIASTIVESSQQSSASSSLQGQSSILGSSDTVPPGTETFQQPGSSSPLEGPSSILDSSNTVPPGTETSQLSSSATPTLASNAVTTIIYTTSGLSGLETMSTISTLSPGSYTTTIIYTSSGTSGPQTITTVATLPYGSFLTTIAETTTGPSGVETFSEVSSFDMASYILSMAGITGGATPTSTTGSSLTSSVLPAAFTGSADRVKRSALAWVLPISVILLLA